MVITLLQLEEWVFRILQGEAGFEPPKKTQWIRKIYSALFFFVALWKKHFDLV
jgi:hypothetical protein